MKDYIVRATAAGGQVRAFAAVTKDIVEEARKHHETSPVATAALGRLLTAGALMGSMMNRYADSAGARRRSAWRNHGNCGQ